MWITYLVGVWIFWSNSLYERAILICIMDGRWIYHISLYFAHYSILFFTFIGILSTTGRGEGRAYFYNRVFLLLHVHVAIRSLNILTVYSITGIFIRSTVSHLLLTIDCNLLEVRRLLLSAFGTNKIAKCRTIFYYSSVFINIILYK